MGTSGANYPFRIILTWAKIGRFPYRANQSLAIGQLEKGHDLGFHTGVSQIIPQTYQLKISQIYHLTVPIDQESRNSLTGSAA